MTDVQPNVTIKVEEDQEDAEVKGCYIWLSGSTQPNLFDETGGKGVNRVKRRRCSVANCDNYFYKKSPSSEPRLLTFHKFPRDERTRAIWVELCNRSDKFSAKSSYICSVHFKPEDYGRNTSLDHNLEKRSNRLRPGAIPCLRLPEVRPAVSQLTNDWHKTPEDEEMESSYEEEEEDDESNSTFSTLGSSIQNRGRTNHCLSFSSEVVTVSSSEDEDTHSIGLSIEINKRLMQIKKRRLDSLGQKYDELQSRFEKLKTETNKEIERLNIILNNKEYEFSRELSEVLSVFLKPEEVESIVQKTVW